MANHEDTDFVGATDQVDAIDLTAEIVSAFVSNNSVPVAGLSDLIHSVHQAVLGLGQPSAAAQDEVEKATPAQIRKSITDEALISFEDGKGYKTLRRHLTIRGLTPESYRAKHGLPADYPMTSAAYSAARSKLARSLGLGQVRRPAEPKVAEVSETVAEAPKARRGRAGPATTQKASAKARSNRKSEASAAAE